MLRLLSIFLFLLSLMSCDISAEFDLVEKHTTQAVQAIKFELNVEPNIVWKRSTDMNGSIRRVTVEFSPKDVKSLDMKKIELISRKAVNKFFKPIPDEIIVTIMSD